PVHRSRRGDRLLARLRAEHAALETSFQSNPDSLLGLDFALAIALFGFGNLTSGPLADLRTAMQPPGGAGGGGCGGGCGGGGGGGSRRGEQVAAAAAGVVGAGAVEAAGDEHTRAFAWTGDWQRPTGGLDDLSSRTFENMGVEGLLVCYTDRLTITPLAAEEIE